MAAPNTNAPFGLMPLASLTGVENIPLNLYYIVSTDTDAYYVGSPVTIGGGADANGVPAAAIGTGTGAYIGSVVGIYPVNPNAVSMVGKPLSLEQVSIPATKLHDYYIMVADDPLMKFTIQGDATATNQTAVKANYNCQLTIAAPSPSTLPQSATVISSASIATTNTLNIKLMGLYQTPGSAFGAYSVYVCKINKHCYADQLAGA
jgi:hypothetical protein